MRIIASVLSLLLLAASADAKSSGSKPSFSGGSSFKPSTFKPSFSAPKPSFSGGSQTPVAQPGSSKPASSTFDRLSGAESRKAESKAAYQKSTSQASTYKTSSGTEAPLKKDKESDYLRGRLDEHHWNTRNQRSGSFYGGWSSSPVVVYNDFYHPMWNYWLMSQSVDIMSMLVYHHQASIDAARLNDMYTRNAELRGRVAALEQRGVARDPTYTPPGVDPDLMYSDGYVNGIHNHHAAMSPATASVLLWVFVYVPLMIGAAVVLYCLIFVYKW